MPGPVELPDLTLDRDGGIRLTLEKSIELAVNGAASVLKAENDVKSSGAQLLQSYGQFLPNLGVAGNYGYASGTVYLAVATPTLVTGSAVGAGYTVTSDLNLFNGLADYSAFKSSLLKKDAADLTYERAKQQIAFDIAQSFLQEWCSITSSWTSLAKTCSSPRRASICWWSRPRWARATFRIFSGSRRRRARTSPRS